MGVDRVILCGGAPAGSGFDDPRTVPLRIYGTDRNVYLTEGDLSAGVFTSLPAAFADLLDIAVYVYAADQAVPRSGAGDGDFAANWRRRLSFRVPVRELDLWQSDEVRDALVSVLSFLSEDEYKFEFVPAEGLIPSPPKSLDFGTTAFDGCVQEVVMFSGGLDSLAGAIREIAAGRKVLLVNHRSNPKPGARHELLVEGLRRYAGDCRPFHVRVRINKDSSLTRETTQRSRSFLYAALGATYATMIDLPRVRFYENGVVSLNLPIGRQVVGANATRTTHPRVLAGFTRLFTAVAGRSLAVENPFLGLTKTDVVRSIAEAGCGDLIQYTVSCAETRGRSIRHPHCGDCSQCLDRRFAVLAAGQADHDPADRYAVDLLTGPRENGDSRILLAAYLDVATRVARMTRDEFVARYGEVGRVLRYLPGTALDAVNQVHRLYDRHARQVVEVLDRELAAAAAAGMFRDPELSAGCLLRLMANDTAFPDREPEPLPSENVFRRHGQAYVVRFAGGGEMILWPNKGVAYLHALLSRPGEEITAAELVSRVARRRMEFGLGSGGEVTDQEALAAYRQRLDELRGEIDEVKANNDFGGQERAEREVNEVAAELRRSTNIRGKLRVANDDREKVRKAVTVAIGRTLATIREYDPSLADHLESSVTRGAVLLYSRSGVAWLT